jgi:nucleoid-associated protein YgaU
MSKLPTGPRSPGPDCAADVSPSAVARWREPAERLPERKLYRPQTLSSVTAELDAIVAAGAENEARSDQHLQEAQTPPTARPTMGAHYTVVRGDTLRGLALKAYHDATKADAIMEANSAILSDPDRVYIGQVLYIP